MKHGHIFATAYRAALVASVEGPAAEDVETILDAGADEALLELYAYARQRKFPPAETLARKAGELTGQPFPFSSIAEAPEAVQVFFTTFRTVAEALEPFYEPDPIVIPEEQTPAPTPPPSPKMEEPVTDPEKPADDIEARTKAAQAETDHAIAESGGKFSEAETPAAKKKNK
jgi:hypothetical protein